MVAHLVAIDTPAIGESINEQVGRWLGSESNLTRARYELIVASFHDDDLAAELVAARDRLIVVLADRGLSTVEAHQAAVALDGLVLDSMLRRRSDAMTNPQELIDRLADRRSRQE